MTKAQAEIWFSKTEIDLALKPLGTTKAASPPDIVYHYTNGAGLEGFIEKGKLWATDSRFLNDSGEVLTGTTRARNKFRQEFWRSSDQLEIKLYRIARDYFNEPETDRTCICSFSEKKDDLSQWRAYSNEGLGFTIGLDAKCLVDKVKNEKVFDFKKVSYNQVHLDRRTKEAINAVRQSIEKWRGKGVDDEWRLRRAAQLFDVVTGTVSASYKHSSFQSENEWRILAFIHNAISSKEMKIRERDGFLIPYVEIDPCDGDGVLPIKEIGIGPSFTDPDIEVSLSILCEQARISPEIYFADTSFRRLI